MRDERKKAVEEHVETVNKLLREARKAGTSDTESEDDSEEEFGGFEDEPIQPVDLEEEYIDEDRYTTVTIEAVNVDKDGMHKPDAEDDRADDDAEDREGKDARAAKSRGAPEKPKKEWPKKPKKKKFRYESKIERGL